MASVAECTDNDEEELDCRFDGGERFREAASDDDLDVKQHGTTAHRQGKKKI